MTQHFFNQCNLNHAPKVPIVPFCLGIIKIKVFNSNALFDLDSIYINKDPITAMQLTTKQYVNDMISNNEFFRLKFDELPEDEENPVVSRQL